MIVAKKASNKNLLKARSASKTSNKNLHKASAAKNDEFYTQLSDIENELMHYKKHFKKKVIFCNCDDPKESNFVKYFSMNFEHFEMKKLIATHYKDATLFTNDNPYKLEFTGDLNGNRNPDPEEFTTVMIGSGDFRSKECLTLLKSSNLVVTNPPFSLFREYVEQLIKYKKKFLIIGNQNAVSYKEIFKLVMTNTIWLGVTKPKKFRVPENNKKAVKDAKGMYWQSFGNICWFTNLDVAQRHQELTLYRKYTKKEYPTYDNYKAIDVSKVLDIPIDYKGVMGVPVTFLDKYNPEQFEILGITDRDIENQYRSKMYTKKDTPKYNDLNRRAALKVNGKIVPVYARILIRHKQWK